MQELLEKLKKNYLAELPDKIEEISEFLQQEDFEQLKNSFHKLKGSGKTYGIPEISDLSLVIESQCNNPNEQTKINVGIALNLLREIHQQRLQNKVFPLSSDPRFLSF